jgi:copper(I)-binding protein
MVSICISRKFRSQLLQGYQLLLFWVKGGLFLFISSAHAQDVGDFLRHFSKDIPGQQNTNRISAFPMKDNSKTASRPGRTAPGSSSAPTPVASSESFSIWVKVSDARVAPAKHNYPLTTVDLTFDSPTDVRLIGARTSDAKAASIFRLVNDHALTEKRIVSSWFIPANQPISLQKAGGILGLRGLTRDLKEGDTVVLYLTFMDNEGHTREQTTFAHVSRQVQTLSPKDQPKKPFQFSASAATGRLANSSVPSFSAP